MHRAFESPSALYLIGKHRLGFNILCACVFFPCMRIGYSCPNHEQVALHLLVKGAEIDKTDVEGYTALMLACQNGHSEVCIAFPCYPGPASILRKFCACMCLHACL